jgi:serine/threonine-protein kinase
VLLQLKTDAEARQREQAAKKLVEETSLRVYDLFPTDPQEALAVVRRALEQVPGDARLIALEEQAVQQLKKAATGERKAQYLKQSQAAIDQKQFDQAAQILEAAAIEYADAPEIVSLLTYAREQKRMIELSQAASNATREAQELIAAGNLEAAIALLQRAASETGDASVEQLLRQSTASLAELNRRIDALVSRARAMSESNAEQALQLLSSQPQEIQQHPRVRELRAKLDAAKGKAAKADRSSAAVPVQQARVAQTPANEPAKPVPQPAKGGHGALVPILIGCIVILALAVAGAAYWYKYLRPAPASVMGALELNAAPYAEVVSVTSERGQSIPLPAGDHWTPLRLDGIPAGRYAVNFKGADGVIQIQQCDVAQFEQVCEIEMKPIDDKAIEEIIGGAK